MITFDLDKLQDKFQNKFYLVLGIVNRVKALKRGVVPVVEKKNKDLITVALEELETDKLSWEVHDEYLPPFKLQGFEADEAGLSDDEADVEEMDAAFAEVPTTKEFTLGDDTGEEETEKKGAD